MASINRSPIVSCPYCKLDVLPNANGTCPSCHEKISVGVVSPISSVVDDTAPDALVLENEEVEGIQELAEEINVVENGLPIETDYAVYFKVAYRCVNRFWGFVITSCMLAFLFLGFFTYFGCVNISSGEIRNAAIAFGIALGMPAILIVFGIAQSHQLANAEITRLALELPGLDTFYALYRPHLRNRFWLKEIDSKKEGLFQALLGRR